MGRAGWLALGTGADQERLRADLFARAETVHREIADLNESLKTLMPTPREGVLQPRDSAERLVTDYAEYMNSVRGLVQLVRVWDRAVLTGTLDELTFTAAWKPSALLIVEVNGTRNSGRLPEGHFTQDVVGTRIRVNISPDLQFNSYLQYDNLSESFGTNTRLRWTFSPVGDLFVVYNHNVNELTDLFDRHRGWRFASNQVLVKAQYAFRY